MISKIELQNALENIYISPLELCNLSCRYCYTKKTKNILSNNDILSFVERYKKVVPLKSILFCGGEVFTKEEFPKLLNILNKQNIFTTIITNGTIDHLKKIKNPANCQLLVSLDGPEKTHDFNRGPGNFKKTVRFIKKALSAGFFVEIMFLINKKSYPYRKTFEKYIADKIGRPVPLNYMTQKTKFYTVDHPLSNNKDISGALNKKQILDIKKNFRSLPDKHFGCFQLSLQSDGKIYGCCESPIALANKDESVKKIISKFKKSLSYCRTCSEKTCHGCCAPDFICGYNREFGFNCCKKTHRLLNTKTAR